jgi:hypothetical protein
MPYDVFISHSSEDKLIAEAVCNRLESAGVRCWIAPRDIRPGEGWSTAILRGIEVCRVMVLVFSDHANESPHVRREVAHACGLERIVIPLRIRQTVPRGDLKYYLSELHWLDALTPPLEKHLQALTARVVHLLSGDQIDPAEAPPESKKPGPPHRVFLRPVTLIVLSVVILFGTVTTIFLSTRNNGQVSVNPIAETAIPIPPVINLPDGLRVVLGEQQALLNDKELDLRNMPGNGIAVIEYKPDLLRVLFAAGPNTYLVEGSDIKHLTSAYKVLEPGGAGAFDNCGAEVGSVVGLKGQLFAFYQAADCEDLPVYLKMGVNGSYQSIGLAESSDTGNTWHKGGQIIKCAMPKEYEDFPNQGVRGIGQPGAVLDPSGRYIYLYYACYSGQKPVGTTQICMARSDISKGPPRPGNWEKLYNTSFSEPGLGGKELPVVDPNSSERVSRKYPHVLYSQALKKYILTFNIDRIAESDNGSPPIKSGIYLALSDDGIKWSRPTKLVNAYSLRMLGLSISIEATIILDRQDGLDGWLVYAYTPKFTNGALPGTLLYMVGRRIQFVKSE